MENSFVSDKWTLEYIPKDNTVCLKWKDKTSGDDLRTALMHAVEMVGDKADSILVMEIKGILDADLKDRNWIRKVLINNLKNTGCKRVIFIVDENETDTVNSIYPYNLFVGPFRTDKIRSYDDLYTVVEHKTAADPEIYDMTREEALAFFGLAPDASREELDEKYWMLTKNFRLEGEEGEKKIADATAAFDIASGIRDEKRRNAEIRAKQKKFMGKTAKEWKVYFTYTWMWYVVGILAVLVGGSLIYNLLFNNIDCNIAVVGHFTIDQDYITDIYHKNGVKDPYITYSNYIGPNKENVNLDSNVMQAASLFMGVSDNVIISDEETAVHFFEAYADISEMYNYLIETYPQEFMDKFTPYYCSERDYHQAQNEYMEYLSMNEYKEDLSKFKDDKVLIGLRVDDPEILAKLGYNNNMSGDEDFKSNLIFGYSANEKTLEKSIAAYKAIFEALYQGK